MIDIIKKDNYCILITGQALSKSYSKDLYFIIQENIDRGLKSFIIDMGKSSGIDSAGLEVLTNLQQELNEMNGRLILINLPSTMQEILRITRVANKLQICFDIEEAESIIEKQL